MINTLLDVDDQVKRDALGVALFGTMWEDLGVEAMEAMAGASQAAYDTEGALEQINQVRYNDLDSALQGIGRQMEVSLLPAADAVYQSLMDNMPEITEAMEEVSPVIAEIAEDFADWAGGAISDGLPVLVDGIKDFADWAGKAYDKAQPFLSFLWEHKGTVLAVAAALRVLGPAIGAVTTAMSMYSKAKGFVALLQQSGKITQITGAFKAFGSALMGPLGIIIAVAAAIALLYKNWDTVKAWLVNFGNTVNQIWTIFPTWWECYRGHRRKIPPAGRLPAGVVGEYPGRRRERQSDFSKYHRLYQQRVFRQLERSLAEHCKYFRKSVRNDRKPGKSADQRGYFGH